MHRRSLLTTLALSLTAAMLAGCSRSPLYTDLTETQAIEIGKRVMHDNAAEVFMGRPAV